MSKQAVQAVLGKAMINDGFRNQLLNQKTREEALEKFQLTAEERQFLLGIQACSLQGLSAAVDQWLETRES